MTELVDKLNLISDVYDDFISGVVNYAKQKPEHINILLHYINVHANITTSDVVKFIMTQPDFHEHGTSSGQRVG